MRGVFLFGVTLIRGRAREGNLGLGPLHLIWYSWQGMVGGSGTVLVGRCTIGVEIRGLYIHAYQVCKHD